MKPERVQSPDETSATGSDTGADATTAKDQETPTPDAAADPAEKRPGATTDMKPERVQKPE